MYLKLKQHPFFSLLLGDFQKCFKSLKEHQYIMLHFRYFFTEIKTQTSSLIFFGACQIFFLKKNDGHVLLSSAKRKKVSIL